MYKRLSVVGIVALAVSLGTMRARGAESEMSVSLNKVPANVRATIQKTDEDDEKGEVKEKKSEKKSEAKHTKKSEAKEGKEEDEDDEKAESKEKKSEAKHAKKSEAKEGKEEDEDDEKAESKEKKSEAKHAKKSEAKEGKEEDEDDEKGEAKEKKSAKKSDAKQAKKAEAKEEDDEKDEGKPTAKPSAKIPGPVQATAKKLIGKGKLLELARESDGTYELDYQVNGVHQAAIITAAGKIEEREITVDASKLPKAVIEAVKKLYPKGKISVAEKSTTKDGTVFELQVTESHSMDVTPEGKVK